MDNLLILTKEPFVGFMPNDAREWLQAHTSEHELAVAFAHVDNKASQLVYACQDEDDYWADYSFEEWYDLSKELESKIRSVLKERNELLSTKSGSRYLLVPFMLSHGYRDGSGWWLPIENS